MTRRPRRGGGHARLLGSLVRRAAVDVRPLRHVDFRRLWLGQSVSRIGFQVTAVAMPVQVYAITGSSLWVGLLSLAGLLPLIVVGLWGGAVADAVDRRALLLVGSATSWVSTWALLVQAVLRLDSVALIMVLIVVQSVGFGLSSPTRNAIVPRLVPTALVPAANTLNFTTGSIATIAGPLAGGAVLGRFGYAGAYAIDAALFTAGFYAAIRLPHIPPLGEGAPVAGLRSVVEGLRYIVAKPVLLMSFVIDIIAMGVAMPRALFPQVGVERFGGTGAVGWLYAAIAIGALLGGLGSGWVGRVHRQGIALIAAVTGWGLAVAAAGFAHRLWLAVLLLAVAGGCDLVGTVYRQTILQTYAPDRMRGRLQGVFTVVVNGGPRLGDLRAGAVASATGATVSWVGGGLACAVLILVVGLSVPALRTYRQDLTSDPEPAAVS